jgi:hypothetical protein
MSITGGCELGRVLSEPSVFDEITRHVFSPALLFGKRMIVAVEKG